jgi:DNA polymerase III delta prime subunit
MSTDADIYALLRQLDRLEELREDLIEIALRGGTSGEDVEADVEADIEDLDEQAILQEMTALGVRSLEDVERRMAELNAQLDERE